MTTKNNIPAGYKDSAVGIIPQEWEVNRLGEICQTFKSGMTITSQNIEKSGLYPVYGGNGLRGYTDSFTHNGDYILIGRQGALCGNINFIRGRAYISEHAIAVQPNEGNSIEFLRYKLDFWNLNRFSESSAQPGLSVEKLVRYKLAVPPLAEQRKIAEILGVWDEAIEKQSRLIEKLELRKRGLMQRLLTGRTRLSGFTTPWQKVKLGEIGKLVSGCVFNEAEQGGKIGFPFFKVSDMNLCGNEVRMTKSNNYVTQEQIERLNYIVVKDEAIIFAKVGAAIALERKRYAKDFIIDNNMLAYVPDTNIWYMKYWFDSIKLSKYIQVGALPSYNASDLAIIKLNLPSLPEQKAIAEVLTAADNEIATHRKKLDALRLQKRGLMQQLLTGKTRVKI